MIVGIGTDIVQVERIKNAIEKYGERFLKRLYTETEIEYCNSWSENKWVHFAARFAAKESFSKAIGTGITKGFKFKEIGVKNIKTGEPIVELAGDLKDKYGHYDIKVSLSHTNDNAVAYVIMQK